MKKHKLFTIAGLLVVFAALLAGCGGGGGADSSSADSSGIPPTPPGVESAPPAGPAPTGAAAPAATPAAAPATTDASGATASTGTTTSTPAATGATDGKDLLPLKAVLPGSTKIRRVSEKQFDGKILSFLDFSYRPAHGDPIAVQLPVEFKDEKMTRSDWIDMFISYAAPMEVLNPQAEAQRIRGQLGVKITQ